MKSIYKLVMGLSLVFMTSVGLASQDLPVDPSLTLSVDKPTILSASAATVTVTVTANKLLQLHLDAITPTSPTLSLDKASTCVEMMGLNAGSSCTLIYDYTPPAVQTTFTQSVGVINAAFVGICSDATISFTVQLVPSTPVVFINSPKGIIHSQNGKVILNYTVLNSSSTAVQIDANSTTGSLPDGFSLLPAGNNQCIVNNVGITLAPSSSCTIMIQYLDPYRESATFAFQLSLMQQTPAIAPLVNIQPFFTGDTTVVSGGIPNSIADALVLKMSDQEQVSTMYSLYEPSKNRFYLVAALAATQSQDELAPIGGILGKGQFFGENGHYVSNVGGSSTGSSSNGYILPEKICASYEECGGASDPANITPNHLVAVLNYDGQYYSDGNNLYKTRFDTTPIATKNLVPSPGGPYTIDGLYVTYTDITDTVPSMFYVTETDHTKDILMIGTFDPGTASITFKVAGSLVMPASTSITNFKPSMKIYVNGSDPLNQTIIIGEQNAPYLMISRDSGATWTAIGLGTLNDTSVITLQDGRTMISVATEARIMYSLDFGASWNAIDVFDYPDSKYKSVSLLQSGTTVYIGYISVDSTSLFPEVILYNQDITRL